MNALQVFTYTDHSVRVIDVNGDPYFVGKDVAEVLGYRDTSDALKKHVDEEDKGVGELPTPGGVQKVITINESGLYSLILQSKLPTARNFKRWGLRRFSRLSGSTALILRPRRWSGLLRILTSESPS
jgi:anti-repressor protein